MPAAATTADARDRVGFWLYAGHLVAVFGIAASNLFLGLSLLWTGRSLRDPAVRRRWSWARVRPIMAPLLLYALALTASVAVSRRPATSVEHLRELIALATLATAPLWVRGERQVRRVLTLLVVMVTALAVWGVVEYYFTDAGELDNRIRGPFSHYMTFSGVLLVGDLLLLARTVTGAGWRVWWHWPALALVNWALFLSLTRGPWVALTVTVAVYFLLRARRVYRVALPAVAVALVILAFGPQDGLDRVRSIGDLHDASNYDRLCMARAGLMMIAERPLFGLGPGVVEQLYPIYRHPTAPRLGVPHLHNSFLELAAERGLLGLGAYLALMAAGIASTVRGHRRDGGAAGPRADLYLGTLLVLVGFNVAGLFEDNWRDSEVQRLVLFLLAVPLCLDATDAGEPADATA